MRAPVGALGEKVGRFLPKAPREGVDRRTRSLPGGRRPRGQPRRMEALTVPMFVPVVALDHSDHALSEAKKRAN